MRVAREYLHVKIVSWAVAIVLTWENTTPWNDGFECGHDDDDPELGEERVLPFRVTRALPPCFHRQRQHTNWIWQG